MARSPATALWGTLPAALNTYGPVDRVELKALLDGELESAMAVLGVEVDLPRVRRVHYLDTPDLALLHRGVIVRARATAGIGEEVVVKLRRPRPHRRRRTSGLALELDALPAEVAWAASLRHCLDAGQIGRAVGRRRPARHLLAAPQRNLLRSVVDDEIDVDGLVALGPVEVVRVTSGGPGDRIGIESWTLPDSSRILELFAKCRPARARQVVDQVRGLIVDHGIVLADRQVTKTQMSLQRIAAAGAAATACEPSHRSDRGAPAGCRSVR